MVAKEPQTVIICPLSPRLFTHERRRVQQRSTDRAAAPDLFSPFSLDSFERALSSVKVS
jgi:hypothetical protein